MRWFVSGLIALALSACSSPEPQEDREPVDAGPLSETAGEAMWVASDRANRRTCPSASCGEIGRLFHRERVSVFERRDGWARITERYSGSCVNGRSEYVESGPTECSETNGIVNGEFAEWVALSDLSDSQPADPAASASVGEALVSQSDDFATHRAAFVAAANELIGEGRCAASDFEEMGGWLKSTNHRDEPIYFTYCGGMTIANRIYLDASTGRIFR